MRTIQIACQLSFCPLGKEQYRTEIDKVLKMINDSGLSAQVGSMSTVITGESKVILSLLERIIQQQAEDEVQYIMNLAISNVCGCDVRI